jgi:hypothetical protein
MHCHVLCVFLLHILFCGMLLPATALSPALPRLHCSSSSPCSSPLQALSRRGCHGSALEATKLLLGLDPEDPLGALLLLDYLALRAGGWCGEEGCIVQRCSCL